MDWSALTHGPMWERYGDELIHGALNFAGAIIILIVGLWIAGAASRMARKAAGRAKHIEPTFVVFFGSIVRYAIISIVIVAVLQRFGVQTTSIIAVLGAATLAIGLALQGALSNVAAGVLIVLYRPYRIGDYVDIVNGKLGTVREVNVFTTELSTLDNIKVVVPNGQIFANPILNYSTSDTRRLNLEFHVAYGADLQVAINEVLAMLKTDQRLMPHPEAVVRVAKFTDAAIVMQAVTWTKNHNIQSLTHELLTAIYHRLKAANIAQK
ncbi:MAG: mechanosensitive ion channel domain-containing protein [Caulobacterales bacterium]